MGLVIDKRLRQGIRDGALVTNCDLPNLDHQVHGCSLDLRIGDIHLPHTPHQQPGSAQHPRRECVLKEGETAVLCTMESFKLDDRHAALVFPASSVSIRGLLMTNPGHVDPGYKGPLHVTVINMGSEPYSLKRGDRLLRALIFNLGEAVATPINALPSPVDSELLQRLSPDFLSVGDRARDAAHNEIQASDQRVRYWQVGLPLIGAIIASVLTYILTNQGLSTRFAQRIDDLEKLKIESRLSSLEHNLPMEQRLTALELWIKQH